MKYLNPRSLFRLLISLLLIVHTVSAAAGEQSNVISSSSQSVLLQHWQIATDQTPKEALSNIPDSVWQSLETSLNSKTHSRGNWLLKSIVVFGDSVSRGTLFALVPMNFITAYEIYWDGEKIAQNGILGVNHVDEKPGDFNYHLLLPPRLSAAGKHIILIRISDHQTYSTWKWYYGDFVIGPYDLEVKRNSWSGYQAFLLIGLVFVPFLFNLFLFFARKRKTEHLLFSVICLLVIADSATLIIPFFDNVPTTYIHVQYIAYQIITVLFAILLPAFFVFLFSLHKGIIALIVLINLIIFMFFTSLANIFNVMSVAVLVESSLLTFWALLLRREESRVISVGLIVGWIAFYFNFAFDGLATIMVICTSFSIARQFARKEKTESEALLRSAHLENELLKKNISPHFLLNSLTSIIVWLRRDSDTAIKLIQALADEFRMVTQISALKQIPILQEIELCKAHLKIMSYRKGAEYQLTTIDIPEDKSVPPMIFHTLIENGLTHGYENQSTGSFILQCKKIADGTQYLLSNDGNFSQGESPESSGFGLRYIKGRLEESYPDRWTVTSGRQARGWETIIEIRDK